MKIVVVVALGLALSAGAALAKDSKEFLRQAIEGHNGEIVLGQLAQLRAGSDRVRDFGRSLATDHAAGKEQALALARKIGLTPPDAPSKEATNARDTLGKLEGDAFDREFVGYMVKDHERDIREFQEQAEATDDNAEVAQYAEATLVKLEQHLETARNLQGHVKSEN